MAKKEVVIEPTKKRVKKPTPSDAGSFGADSEMKAAQDTKEAAPHREEPSANLAQPAPVAAPSPQTSAPAPQVAASGNPAQAAPQAQQNNPPQQNQNQHLPTEQPRKEYRKFGPSGGGGGGGHQNNNQHRQNNNNQHRQNNNNNQGGGRYNNNQRRDFRNDRNNNNRGGSDDHEQQMAPAAAVTDHDVDFADINLTEEEKSWLNSKDLKSKNIQIYFFGKQRMKSSLSRTHNRLFFLNLWSFMAIRPASAYCKLIHHCVSRHRTNHHDKKTYYFAHSRCSYFLFHQRILEEI